MKLEEKDSYRLCMNCVESGNILGIPQRRWIDAILFGGITVLIIFVIPFTELVTGVLAFTIGGSVIAFCLRGICNRSVTEMLIAEFKFKKNIRVLHLRGPEYVKEKQDFSKYAGGNETNGERLLRKIKNKANAWGDILLEETSGQKP